MWLFGISEISFCGDGDGQTNSLINDSTGEPPYRNAPPVREGVVANIESEPSALEERTEELIITTLQERKGALGDGQEVSEVHKALEMDFQIETIADELTLIKKMAIRTIIITRLQIPFSMRSETMKVRWRWKISTKAIPPKGAGPMNHNEDQNDSSGTGIRDPPGKTLGASSVYYTKN